MATATEVSRPQNTILTPARKFRQLATDIASSMLTDWVGKAKAGEAVGRISAALSAAAAAAKDPSDFYACTPQSVGQCVAIAALTEIMPGTGATALAYVIPRRPRKGEDPQLQFQFSHRGLAALAARVGCALIAVPVGMNDQLQISDGEVAVHTQDPDDPVMTWDGLRGAIVIVKMRDNGQVVYRGWMPKTLIDRRRQASDTFQWAEKTGGWAQEKSPWHVWPVEMAMKTAMHYAISRGWCVIDDAAATRAMAVEQSQDIITVQAEAPPRIDNSMASDALADRLEQSDSQTTTREAELLAMIDTAGDVEAFNRVEDAIAGAEADGSITGAEAARLRKHLEDKAG